MARTACAALAAHRILTRVLLTLALSAFGWLLLAALAPTADASEPYRAAVNELVALGTEREHTDTDGQDDNLAEEAARSGLISSPDSTAGDALRTASEDVGDSARTITDTVDAAVSGAVDAAEDGTRSAVGDAVEDAARVAERVTSQSPGPVNEGKVGEPTAPEKPDEPAPEPARAPATEPIDVEPSHGRDAGSEGRQSGNEIHERAKPAPQADQPHPPAATGRSATPEPEPAPADSPTAPVQLDLQPFNGAPGNTSATVSCDAGSSTKQQLEHLTPVPATATPAEAATLPHDGTPRTTNLAALPCISPD